MGKIVLDLRSIKMPITYAVRMVVTGSDLSVCLVYMKEATLVVHGRNKGHDQMT